ncbi:MAG: hypothetical protein WD511_00065 [Balneolaceae bacterium]
MKLKNLDINYRDSITSTVKTLKNASSAILDNHTFDLSKTDISEAILERLKTYYETQQEIKQFLNKRYQTPGADFLVETVTFFIQLYLQNQGGQLEAHSERQIRPKRGSIRPDISIWEENKVKAIVECKTQLGWNRHNWENDFEKREKKLKKEFPNAEAFLLVMTGRNWGGFGDNAKLGEKYFCLLDNIWPTDYKEIGQLMTPVEQLIK